MRKLRQRSSKRRTSQLGFFYKVMQMTTEYFVCLFVCLFCKSLSECEYICDITITVLKISPNNDKRGRHLEFYFHTHGYSGMENRFQCIGVRAMHCSNVCKTVEQKRGPMQQRRPYWYMKMARYSFSESIPAKFEHKLRRHKQTFGKIATTVVLDKDENLL